MLAWVNDTLKWSAVVIFLKDSRKMSSLVLKNTDGWSEHTERLVGIDVGEEINPLGRCNL